MLIESTQLDWRQNLDVPCSPFELDDKVVAQLRRVLDQLNLRMGIFDLKLNGSTPTWLELNPQGQFLFAEGLSGIPLNAEIARFLRQEALAAAGRRHRQAGYPSLTGSTRLADRGQLRQRRLEESPANRSIGNCSRGRADFDEVGADPWLGARSRNRNSSRWRTSDGR